MTTRQLGAVLAATLLLPLGVAACGLKEDVIDLTESGVASEGATEFKNVGVDLDGSLDCTLTEKPGTTDENADPAYTLKCTGTTVDGQEVTLDGDTEQASFIGKVDGRQVWAKDCIGSDC